MTGIRILAFLVIVSVPNVWLSLHQLKWILVFSALTFKMPTSLYSSGESGDSAAEKKHPKKRKKASSFAVDIIQEHLQQTQQPTRSRVVEVHSINRRRPSCSFQVDNDGTISPAATIAPTPRSSLQRAHQRSRFFPRFFDYVIFTLPIQETFSMLKCWWLYLHSKIYFKTILMFNPDCFLTCPIS